MDRAGARHKFQAVWVRIAPEFYKDAPRPDADVWMVRLAWRIWQEALGIAPTTPEKES